MRLEQVGRYLGLGAVLISGGLAGCNSIPGTEGADTAFRHQFSIKDQSGEFIGPDDLEFTAEPDDFDYLWGLWIADNPDSGRLRASRLFPQLTLLDTETLDLSGDGALCLTGPIVLYPVGGTEPVAEVPEATCLDNDGSTILSLN